MKIEFTLEADRIIPALYFHQELGHGGGLSDFFPAMVTHMCTEHPDARFCSVETCEIPINPIFITRDEKYCPHPYGRFKITTEPATCCPDCGAPVITAAELDAKCAERKEVSTAEE